MHYICVKFYQILYKEWESDVATSFLQLVLHYDIIIISTIMITILALQRTLSAQIEIRTTV